MSSRTGFGASRTGSASSASSGGDRVGWFGANHPAFLEVLFATAKLGAVIAPVNHRLDHTVVTDVLMGYSPTVVVVEQAAAGVSLPPGVGSRVVVGTATGAEIGYEHLVAEAPTIPSTRSSDSTMCACSRTRLAPPGHRKG